jgi:uncharacterized damage-inducible protein DinB
MKKIGTVTLMGMTLVAVVALASLRAQGGDVMTKATKSTFDMVKGYITKSAEQVPEADYAFKPTPAVRSFGQLVGHVADSNYMICGAAASEKPPAASVEKTKTTKADLQKALADSFAYCDKVFAGMSDAKGTEAVNFFGNQQPRLNVLAFNTAHDFEHYGNIVTYMRLKGMVPPSSQKGGM